MDRKTLKQFAARALELAGDGGSLELPDLSAESPSWISAFTKFNEFFDRFQAGELGEYDRRSIFSRDGNMKLPFLSFSSLPFADCPGMGDCEKFCYSPKGWRNIHPFFRQLRNSILVRYEFKEISAELARLMKLPTYAKRARVPFRLYVDGDFATADILSDWMELVGNTPKLKAYGYSKSWELLISHKEEWPSNYLVNLSSGSRYHINSGIARGVAALPCVRGKFLAIGSKGKTKYGTPAYRKLAKGAMEKAGIERGFICGGLCGPCGNGDHICGSERFDGPVVILTH